MLDVLKGFVTELRAAGLPVSLTESIDAAEAVGHIPLEDREALKYALGATLVKSSAHWRAFETAFEVYFSMRGSKFAIDGEQAGDSELLGIDLEQDADQGQRGRGRRGGGGGGEALSPEELAELLYRALREVNDARHRRDFSVRGCQNKTQLSQAVMMVRRWISGGMVAEKNRVCLLAAISLKMRSMSGMKPMSSMRSASSTTMICTPVSSSLPRSKWSSRRPGVAISTSTPRSSLASWSPNETPPISSAQESFLPLA